MPALTTTGVQRRACLAPEKVGAAHCPFLCQENCDNLQVTFIVFPVLVRLFQVLCSDRVLLCQSCPWFPEGSQGTLALLQGWVILFWLAAGSFVVSCLQCPSSPSAHGPCSQLPSQEPPFFDLSSNSSKQINSPGYRQGKVSDFKYDVVSLSLGGPGAGTSPPPSCPHTITFPPVLEARCSPEASDGQEEATQTPYPFCLEASGSPKLVSSSSILWDLFPHLASALSAGFILLSLLTPHVPCLPPGLPTVLVTHNGKVPGAPGTFLASSTPLTSTPA